MVRRPTSRAARRAAVAALAVGWALALAPVGAAFAASSPSAPDDGDGQPHLATFGITSASDGAPDDRSFLAMTAAPGSVIYDSVAVVNQSDEPLDLALYTADAQNAPDGTIGLPDRTVAATDAGAWITVGSPTVSVPAQTTSGIGYTLVPITVTIPSGAEPGDHVAGVVTSLTASGTAAGADQSATVDLEQRVGLRVYITVDGAATPGLVITDIHATYHQAAALGLAGAGSATVTYTMTNTGNKRLSVQATTDVSGPFGLGRVSAGGKAIDEILPRASITETVELAHVWPLVLDSVEVTAAVGTPVAGLDPGLADPTASVRLWAVPWAALALLVLVAAGWWWLRHRRQRRAGSGRGRRARPNGAGPDRATAPELPQTQAVS